MGNPYDRYRTLPAQDIEKADAILSTVDHRLLESDADTIAYSRALLELAQVKMTGSMRR